MEVKEFQIGDWVSSPRLEHNGGGSYQYRLENITQGYEYDPIPLTEEMLLENCFASYCDNVVEICAIGLILTFDIDRWFASWGNIQIKYVHELQHLLRLCGLSDLADNFKIK